MPSDARGPWRKVRGQQYVKFLADFYGKPVHSFDIVAGSGHNATSMFESPVALMYMFKADESVAPTDAAFASPFPCPHIAAAIAREQEEGDDLGF